MYQPPLYETSYMGFYIKVFPDRIDFKNGKGAQSIPLNQITGIQLGMMGMMGITITTTNGQSQMIPTSKKKEVEQAIRNAQAHVSQSPYQSAPMQSIYQQQAPSYPMQQPPKPWHQTNVGIIVLLVLFFPIGLYLMWRYARWGQKAKWIVTGIIAVLVIIFGVTNQTSPTGTTTETSTQPTQVQHSNTEPIATPTATPKPLTTEQRIMAIAKEHNGTDSAYDGGTKSFQTTIKLGAQWSNGTMKDSVKMECYNLQKALYTANPALDLETSTIFIHGDVVDAYGNEKVAQVGFCNLKKGTAAKFNWQNLTWRTAWDVYDNQGLAPFLQNA